MATEAEIKEFLKGLNFPAVKNEILGIAKNNNASGDVTRSIKNLPKDKYVDIDELAKDIMNG